RHSGFLLDGNGALATQYKNLDIQKTDFSRNNSSGDIDNGHAEILLLGFNGNLTVKDVVVTSGLINTQTVPFYGSIRINGTYSPVKPSGTMLFENITFNSAA